MKEVFKAATNEQLEAVRQLFVEYSDYLFEMLSPYCESLAERISRETLDEASALPGEYVEPGGCILLAEYHKEVAGCIAVSEIDGDTCVLKRIYVKPQFQRMGIGKKLVNAIIEQAVGMGYKQMRLHTTGAFVGAKELYRSFGFIEDGHIEGSPIENSVHMKLNLR